MRLFLLTLTLIIAAIVLVVLVRAPRSDRNWQKALSRAPEFSKTTDGVWTIDFLRTYEFDRSGVAVEDWRKAAIDPADLKEIWFFVEPFKDWDAVAHSFLSFVFAGADPQTISVSVEARREEGEEYSPINGLFNVYELLYIWSTEKDILTRIAVNLDHDLYAYRLDLTPEQARAILDHFIARTNRLHDRPRFYNTLTSNCTNELAKAVNEAFPTALPWHPSHVLTGRSAEHLYDLQFIAGSADFENIKSDAEIRQLVHAHRQAPEPVFSSRWRDDFLKHQRP